MWLSVLPHMVDELMVAEMKVDTVVISSDEPISLVK